MLFVTCISNGNPLPDIQWYLNKIPINRVMQPSSEYTINQYTYRYLSMNFKRKKVTKSTLIFKKIIVEDNNNFLTCESENVMGTATDTTKINVYEKRSNSHFPTVILEDNSTFKLKKRNSPTILHCNHKNSPNAKVYWYKNFEYINEPDYDIFQERSLSKLFIKNILDKDEGSYKCLVVNKFGGKLSTSILIKIGDIPPPINQISITEISANSANICWAISSNYSIIEEFIINYKIQSQIKFLSIRVGKKVNSNNNKGFECSTLKKLQPFTTYKVWIISSNSLGQSEIGKHITFDTLEDLPFGPPKSITASAISNTAVEVRWKPVEKLNGILKKYILLYTEHPDLPYQHWRHFDTKTDSSLISHLTPNKIHDIRIQAVNSIGKGPLSKPVAILTKSGTISECPEFRATYILLNSITLEWEEPDPSKLQNCLGLQLEIITNIQSGSSEKKTININVNQYSYEIRPVKEDEEMLFILRAYNQVGFGMPVKYFLTSAGKAKINKNVIEVLERTSFTIVTRWRKPNRDAINMTLQLFEIHGKSSNLIRTYKLENYKYNSQIDEWNISNFTRLNPNQKYKIRLTFLNEEETGPVRESFYLSNIIETKKAYTMGVGYFNLKIRRYAHDILAIHAEWEDVPNLVNSSTGTIYQMRYRISYPEELSTDYQSVVINSTSFIINLSDKLMYGVTYELILSRHGNNNAKLESKKFLKMPEGKPLRPPQNIHISNMSESSVTIAYQHPPVKYRNGKIIFFEVEIKPINNEKYFKIINTTKTIISFYNLDLRTYKTRVRAYTSIGCGPWSDFLEFTVHDVDINPPREIKAFRIMESKIKVEWKMGYDESIKPYVFLKNIVGFVLYYGTRDTLNITTTWKQIKIYENIYSYEIKNVQATDFYIVRMSSIDKYKRIGRWSLPAVPENVDLSVYNIKTFSNLRCYFMTTNSLEIHADYPIDTKYLNSILVIYNGQTVYWSLSNPQTIDIFLEKKFSLDYTSKDPVFKLILKELHPNAKYTVQIIPIYSTHLKLDSNISLSANIQCQTKPEAPTYVASPDIVGSSTFYITLRIIRTEERHGKIDDYHLLVVPHKSKSNITFYEYDKPPNDFSLIELSANINEKNKIQPFLAFSKSTNSLFNQQQFYDFLISYKNVKEGSQNSKIDGTFYRSALRACVQAEEGQLLCNTSQWSKSFQLNSNLPLELKSPNRKITDATSKYNKFNDNAIITLSITLSGIMLAVVGIIIGCVVHKKKFPRKKWENPLRSSAPELLQDVQLTPLVDVSSPKLNHEMIHLRTDQNYAFDSNNEILNYKGYKNNKIGINHFDSPIPQKSKNFNNHQETAPDIVNVCDGFHYFNNDIQQAPSNISSKYAIPVNKLADHVEQLKSYDSLNLMQEFEELNKETFEKYDSINSNLPQNKMKNRYANVVAYDHSLVILKNQLDRENSNYINANYINGWGKQNEYIATQGPLPETINDFWQMVWDQRTTIIVMLLRVEESESKKCEIYWPKKGTRIYLDIEVTLKSSISRAYYIIRTFQVKQNGFSMKRQIYHLQFTWWPDQGIPVLCDPFISFIKVYRSFNKFDSGPTVVHCSAGVGRTGVFIAIDSQMERIKLEKSVDVYDQIKSLRKQRNYMVQTEAQYGFVYDVLLEWSQENVVEINPDMLISHIKTKSQLAEGNTLTGFETEFQKLNLQSTNINANMSRIHGNATANKQKNNSPHLLPFDWNRVALSSMTGVDGSDYINASSIDSYLTTKAYIVSQDPMASTVEDFWRLVWDKNCSIIIVLGKLDEFVKDLNLPYWPVQKSIRYQFFVVDPMVEYNMSNYIMREFKVTDARDGEFRTIRQFHYSKWLSNVCPCDAHSFLEFIHQVQLTKENFGYGNPLLVHCSYGTGKSGIFIAVNNILEKLKHENIIDVYSAVKLLQQQRVGLVQTVDQYKFCYLSILTHLIDVNPDLKAQFCGFKEYISTTNNN